jgi:hypothetical protein
MSTPSASPLAAGALVAMVMSGAAAPLHAQDPVPPAAAAPAALPSASPPAASGQLDAPRAMPRDPATDARYKVLNTLDSTNNNYLCDNGENYN